MAAVLRVINFYERDNIEGQRLPRVFNFHLPWEDFSDDELLKGYRFGQEYLLFIARERSETTNKAKPGSSLKRLMILIVVVVGGFAAGRPPVFLWDCIIPEFFCQFGPCFATFLELLLVYAFHSC